MTEGRFQANPPTLHPLPDTSCGRRASGPQTRPQQGARQDARSNHRDFSQAEAPGTLATLLGHGGIGAETILLGSPVLSRQLEVSLRKLPQPPATPRSQDRSLRLGHCPLPGPTPTLQGGPNPLWFSPGFFLQGWRLPPQSLHPQRSSTVKAQVRETVLLT